MRKPLLRRRFAGWLGLALKASVTRGGYGPITGSEYLVRVYNFDNRGTNTEIPSVHSAQHGDAFYDRDGLHSEADSYDTNGRSIAFTDNYTGGIGGALYILRPELLEVSNALFKSNRGSLGGAAYIATVDDKQTLFSACVFEENEAEDGGAVYLYTGPGLDIFNFSTFLSNSAGTSGGAIFHTGSLRLYNTYFVSNEVSVEGPAIMSIGVLEEISNVSFLENTYHCRVGEYGYTVEPELLESDLAEFWSSCLDEVCSRCSASRNGPNDIDEVRIDGLPVCALPPLGAIAPSHGTTLATLTLEKGYFRTSSQSHDVRKCYHEHACRGGSNADDYCSSGYTGPYCATCADGFAPGIAYSCRECSEDVTRSAVGLAVGFVMVMTLSACLVLFHLGSVIREGDAENTGIVQRPWMQKCLSFRASLLRHLPLTAIKIVVTVWQIISQFDAIAGDVYPELYTNFISNLSPVNLDLDFVFSYSCLFNNDFYHRLIFDTVAPLIVLVVLAISYYVGNKRNRWSVSAIRDVQHKHQAAILYVALFVYSPVSFRISKTFTCDELDDGETYLRADYRLSCLTSRHRWYEIYAFTMVAVYPVGIAAAFTWLLFSHRRDLVKSDRGEMSHLKPLRGIWAAYKPSRYYYEVVECTRRIAMTAIAAFVPSESIAHVSIALLFSVVFVFISEICSPFDKGVDMGLYRWGNGIIVASMYVAFLMKTNAGYDTEEAYITFSSVLIAANMFMVIAVMLQTGLFVNALRRVDEPVSVVELPVRRTCSTRVRRVVSDDGRGLSEEEEIDMEI